MCFSASASFGASAVLGVMGVVAITKARTIPQRLFASIPLLFSVQQLVEGMLWLSLKDPGLVAWQPFFTYTFLVFATMVWPVWIPLTIRLLEKDAKRKKKMNILLSVGSLVFIGIGCVLLLYRVRVIPGHHHLHYDFNFPERPTTGIVIFSLLYFAATIITPFTSGIKKMKWLGIVFGASYLFAVSFYSGFVISVWCFFAAILSFVVLWIILELRKPVRNLWSIPKGLN
ncbi:MAG: DUF6629 family protein [Bacteroidota bacterium]